MPERSSEYPIRPSEDEYGRNCCLQPKPTPSASVPYVPPTCELSSDEIDELLRMLEDYQAQEDLSKIFRGEEDGTEELPYPTQEQLDKMIECVDVGAMTDEQVKRFNETTQAALEGITEGFQMAMVYCYMMQQTMCNPGSQWREEIDGSDVDLPALGEFCETDIEIPQSIKDVIDKIVEGDDINVWDQIKINLSPEARRVIDNMIGDAGNYIDKDELGKFKDELDWGLYTTD